MRTQLNRIAEIGAEFAKLGVQMGMPTGFNYFRKSKDWLNDIYMIYTSPQYKVSSKSTFEDAALFVYKDIRLSINPDVVEIPLRITDEQLDVMINELESELKYLKTAEGLLELKAVVEDAWNEKKWV
jgi:hypothetical protein